MSYVVAAYGVTAIALVLYGLHLKRERRRLEPQARAAESSGSG